MTASAVVALLSAGPGLAQDPLVLPSGLDVALIEVIFDAEMQAARFRFVAPAIAAPGFGMNAMQADMEYLCDRIAAPALRRERPHWEDVVISISSAAIAFGTSDPEIIQAFEGFTVDREGCIWQQF